VGILDQISIKAIPDTGNLQQLEYNTDRVQCRFRERQTPENC